MDIFFKAVYETNKKRKKQKVKKNNYERTTRHYEIRILNDS
jgi:hypothetical protein